jgi:hypothetical protein
VAVPLNSCVTLAVNVTDCPKVEGFSEEVKVVVVVALLTTCFNAFDVLLAKFESPPYTAVIELVPTLRVEVVKLAEPLLSVPVPNTVVPFLNVTVSPSGGAGATTAMRTTACP